MTVIGEPGIGKSRLARELAARLGDRATVLEGRCLPYGSGITYWPVREMVLQAAGGRPLEALTAGLPDGAAAAASVAGTLGLGEGAPGEATPWGFRRLFAAVARDAPLVLQFDDVHWAEPPLLELVDDLAARLTDAPVLLLCLARPELLAAHPAWAPTAVRLGPLSADESRRAAGRPRADSRSHSGRRSPSEPAATRSSSSSSRCTSPSTKARRDSRRRCTLCWPLDLICSPHRSDRFSTPRRSRESAFTSAACSRSSRTSTDADARSSMDMLVDRELLLPATSDIAASRHGAFATRWCGTPPTRRCRRA